ncbi:hypothetical protein [Phenylobacterium sp.]|uniref:hypothetical protein n=1 Tax=Phenylobacterium sp. TaxID=1871053 RepID=UPI003982D969
MSGGDKLNRKFDQHDDHLKVKDFDETFGNLDPSSTKDGAGPSNDLYVGSGNSAANFKIFTNHDDDIELGLKIKLRQGPDILPGADGSFDVPDGTQPGNPARAAWSFDFSVNTGIEGSTQTLDAFDFRLIITSGDGERAVYNMLHIAPGVTLWTDGVGGFADADGTANAQISQNSVNLGFGFLKSIFGADYADAGERYDIELQAFDGLRLVGKVLTSVDLI